MATATTVIATPRPMSAQAALSLAWKIWFALLAIPFFVSLAAMIAVTGAAAPAQSTAQAWFIGALGWTGVAIPLAFFVRSRLFRSYWEGGVVTPARYVLGMSVVWGAIEIAGLIAIVGMLLGRSIMPGLIPAMLAFVLFLPLWPSGRAMVDTVGAADDSSVFRHPR